MIQPVCTENQRSQPIPSSNSLSLNFERNTKHCSNLETIISYFEVRNLIIPTVCILEVPEYTLLVFNLVTPDFDLRAVKKQHCTTPPILSNVDLNVSTSLHLKGVNLFILRETSCTLCVCQSLPKPICSLVHLPPRQHHHAGLIYNI